SRVPRLPLLHDNGPLHPQIAVDATEVLEDPRRLEGQGKGAAGAGEGPDGARVEHLGRVEDAGGPGGIEDDGIPDELHRTVRLPLGQEAVGRWWGGDEGHTVEEPRLPDNGVTRLNGHVLGHELRELYPAVVEVHQ